MPPPKKQKKTSAKKSNKTTKKTTAKKTIKKKTTPKKTTTARKSPSFAVPKKKAAAKKAVKKIVKKKTSTKAKRKKPITVHIAPTKTPLWKRALALFFLALFVAVSGSLLYFSNPVFRNNVDGISRYMNEWSNRIMASVYDLRLLSANTLSLPGPGEAAVNNYFIVSCDQCDSSSLTALLPQDTPTQTLDYTSSEAQKMIVEHGIKYLPAIIESKENGSVVKYAKPSFYLKEPSIVGAYFKGGSSNSPVKVFAYLDFTDPMSAQAAADLDALVRDNDRVRMYFKPVVKSERQRVMTLAFECAAQQNRAWPMHNWIFNEMETDYSFDSMIETAKDFIHIDRDAFVACMQSEDMQKKLDRMASEQADFHISQTPTVIINGSVLSGKGYSLDALNRFIDATKKQPSITPESMSWGNDDSAVTLVEYCDYESPFCAEYFQTIYPEIQAQFGEEVRYVKRDFPLTPIHKNAHAAAHAARCAADQGKHYQMAQKLYSQRSAWHDADDSNEIFTQFAGELGLDSDAFESCLADDSVRKAVQDDFDHGVSIGVDAIPTILLYRADGSSRFVEGILSYKDFERLINQELSQ